MPVLPTLPVIPHFPLYIYIWEKCLCKETLICIPMSFPKFHPYPAGLIVGALLRGTAAFNSWFGINRSEFFVIRGWVPLSAPEPLSSHVCPWPWTDVFDMGTWGLIRGTVTGQPLSPCSTGAVASARGKPTQGRSVRKISIASLWRGAVFVCYKNAKK